MLLTVSGLMMGWMFVQLQWIKQRREAWLRNRQAVDFISGGHSIAPPWSLRMFGETESTPSIISINMYTHKRNAVQLQQKLQRLFPEKQVKLRNFYYDPVTDTPIYFDPITKKPVEFEE